MIGLCRVSGSDEDGRLLWNTPCGDFWTPPGASAKYVAGIVAEQQADSYSHPAVPSWAGLVVLDCGANVGVFTRRALSCGAASVIAVEPSRENALCFRRNLAAEIKTGRVILCQNAVGDREGRLWLNTSNTANPGSWSVSADSAGRGHAVEMTTLDRLVEEHRPGRIGMIKIDVEGCELAVVRGAQATLARHLPSFAIAVEHVGEEAAEVIPAIRGLEVIRGNYASFCGFYRCDDARRLVPQIVYFVPRQVPAALHRITETTATRI
jgi:FkbM family methyltransferase